MYIILDKDFIYLRVKKWMSQFWRYLKLYNELDNSAIRKKSLIVKVEEMILFVKLKDLSFFVMCLLFGHLYNFLKLVIF